MPQRNGKKTKSIVTKWCFLYINAIDCIGKFHKIVKNIARGDGSLIIIV